MWRLLSVFCVEGHSVAGWGIGGVCLAAECGSKIVCSGRQ